MIHCTISPAHIRRGKPGRADACPAALALDEQTDAGSVSVRLGCVTLDGKRYRTPDALAAFVSDFDCGYPVAPLTFTLEPL